VRSLIIVTGAVLSAAPYTALAQTPQAPSGLREFAIDAGHTIVEFSVGFAITKVKGRFAQTRGTILYDAARPENSSVTVVIDAKSIDTGWPHRDEHLRTDDFFDVEKFPTITFQSTRIERRGADLVATGPFTMHGVTKTIAIPFRLLEEPSRGAGSRTLTLYAAGAVRINRKDYGVFGGATHNSWFNALRSATVSDSVDINLEIGGWTDDAASQRPPEIDAAIERIRTSGVPATLDRFRQVKASRTPAEFEPYFRGGDLTVRALIADGRTTEASALARGLVELYPEVGHAHLVYGFALASAGDNAGAERQYAQARAVYRPFVRDPNEKFPQDDPNWYYSDLLVRTAHEFGRAREAVALGRAMTALFPGSARTYAAYGIVLARAGDKAGAAEAYAKALAIDANETRAIEWKRRLDN
jgi:polyisoprenoid-binding protein YceI